MGDEPFFIDQLSQLLTDTVLPQDQRDFNQTILYGKDTSIEEIVSVCKRFPMMADHQLVVVREAHELSRSIEKLEAYAAQPQATTVLVICYKNKKLDKRKKLYKAVAKNGTVVETKKSMTTSCLPGLSSVCANKNERLILRPLPFWLRA